MTLGVLGGMGPAAAAYFTYRLAVWTKADRDQDHLRVLLSNDPDIPDRSAAIVGHGESPVTAMQKGLLFLKASGCNLAVIPCNTAHHWFDELQGSVDMPLLHIVETVLDSLKARGVEGGCIGLLGTPATVSSNLYREPLTDSGYTVLPLTDEDASRLCVRPIQAVKQGRLGDAAVSLGYAIRVLSARGATAVILACTELPVAFAELNPQEFDLPIIDSVDALAISALKHCGRDIRSMEGQSSNSTEKGASVT